ncbi:MAG: hypothetical protein HRT64_07645 [Erythrobacter sp.]|nr:hypothetical protein [Erythrobacter sp.]
MTEELSPGEVRTRQRKRREIITYIAAGTVGGTIGFLIAFTDKGDGNPFSGDWEKLILDPMMAVILSIALFVGLVALPLWAFTVSDGFVKERNYIGYMGGGMAFMAGVPIWARLHAGSLAPAPTAFAAWVIGFAATMISFAFAWIRSR